RSYRPSPSRWRSALFKRTFLTLTVLLSSCSLYSMHGEQIEILLHAFQGKQCKVSSAPKSINVLRGELLEPAECAE
ncbi:carbon storage regulator, partial [Oleiphilus sp. HI0066]|uniref:carbon storage regulator n=1 Tax=Oleiphilus sp. HI0066 TaxID=1822242 RepID=UPI001E4E8509